ncbi:MAG TPA: hypothetical protein EYP30_10060 [Archaeoglobaceae archaeon]|nr:hypothetical protein [Archaeoglobaceae archaeon]
MLDYKDAKKVALMRKIISYYLAGYDSLTVKTYNDEQREAITLCSEVLIGFEVLEDIGSEIQTEVFS